MENQNTLPTKRKLIIEHTASDGGTPTLVCRGRITMEAASQFQVGNQGPCAKTQVLKGRLRRDGHPEARRPAFRHAVARDRLSNEMRTNENSQLDAVFSCSRLYP